MAIEIQPDDRALRSGRRERAFAQMEARDLDVLVLGRQANVRYFTGAPQLWVAGTRPFGPICTVVRSTRDIHLNSTWDEGIPAEIPHDHLYGLAWNPMTLISVLQGVDGAATARRVGTDALSPTFAKLLPMAFPNAELVDGEPAMRDARRIKTSDELTAIRSALRVAEDGLAAAVAELTPGASEQALTGALLEAMAAGGVSTPATQDGAWVTSREHPWRRAPGDGRVAPGDLVAFAAGVLADGYVGEVGRTWPVGDADGEPIRKLFRRWNELWDRLVAACRPGAAASELFAAYESAGEPLPPMPVAHGLGLGFDPPVVSPRLPTTAADERLDPGMVLAITGYVWERGVGAVFGRDAILVSDDGAEVLTSSPSWNSAATAIGASNG
jgi:Xaa-Pro dipeptidase